MPGARGASLAVEKLPGISAFAIRDRFFVGSSSRRPLVPPFPICLNHGAFPHLGIPGNRRVPSGAFPPFSCLSTSSEGSFCLSSHAVTSGAGTRRWLQASASSLCSKSNSCPAVPPLAPGKSREAGQHLPVDVLIDKRVQTCEFIDLGTGLNLISGSFLAGAER